MVRFNDRNNLIGTRGVRFVLLQIVYATCGLIRRVVTRSLHSWKVRSIDFIAHARKYKCDLAVHGSGH